MGWLTIVLGLVVLVLGLRVRWLTHRVVEMRDRTRMTQVELAAFRDRLALTERHLQTVVADALVSLGRED